MSASVSSTSTAAYYLDPAAIYFQISEPGSIGVWYGEGSEALGYTGPIYPDALRAAFLGFTPDGKTQLVQRHSGKHHQAAWDITLSVPKSVSVLWSIVGPDYRDKIERIVIQASKRIVEYVDDEVLLTRRGKGGKFLEKAKGVHGLFLEGMSRAQDPHLHLHWLCFSQCLRGDGTTGTIRSWDLYNHKMAIGALFRVELSYLLQKELGLSISQDGWKFKVDGVSDDLCRDQSKRGQAIEEIAKDEEWESPKVRSHLARITRGPKEYVLLEECFGRWEAEAKKYGFTREVAEKLTSIEKEKAHIEELEKKIAQDKAKELENALTKSIESVSAFKAYFPERDLVRDVATRAQGKEFSVTDVIAAVKDGLPRFENRVRKDGFISTYYSTRENIAAEKELITRAEKGKESTKHIVSTERVTKAKERIERKLSKAIGVPTTFTVDQEKSLRHITQTAGKLKIIQGVAGSGKTEMLGAAHIAWKASGFKVIGTSITGRAALGLQKTTGIPSVTVDLLLQVLSPKRSLKGFALRFLWELRRAIRGAYYDSIMAGRWLRNPWKEAFLEITRKIKNYGNTSQTLPDLKLTSRSILVVDEAAMVPTKVLLELQRLCDKRGVKLVLLGDRLQLPPIGAGGPFWSLTKTVGVQSLTTIVRQKKAWMRDALAAVINNQPERALKLYEANGALHLEKHQRAAIQRLVADYGKLSTSELSKSVALTATNDEARQINQAMQTKRKAKRELGLGSLRLSNGQRVYKNDRVLLTVNDYRLGIRNGLLGTVVKIQRTRGIMGPGSITVVLDGQKYRKLFPRKSQSVTIDLKKYPHVQLGYAVTTHKVQGITVKNCFVLLGEMMMSIERAFTQLSRASDMTHLYGTKPRYGPLTHLLATLLSKRTEKDLAHDHTILKKENVYEQSRAF